MRDYTRFEENLLDERFSTDFVVTRPGILSFSVLATINRSRNSRSLLVLRLMLLLSKLRRIKIFYSYQYLQSFRGY